MESSPGNITKEEGLRLLKAGQINEAIAVLVKLAESNPDDPQVQCYLGAAYNRKGDRLHAVHAFEESLRIEETPKAYYNLGLVYESAHRYEEAVRQFSMAISLDPNYAQAQQALDKIHAQFEAEQQALHPASQAAPPEPAAGSAASLGNGAVPDCEASQKTGSTMAQFLGKLGIKRKSSNSSG